MADFSNDAIYNADYVLPAALVTLVGLAKDLGDPLLLAKLEQRGLLVDRHSDRYPFQLFLELVELVSRAKYPDLPDAEKLFRFGREARDYYATHTIQGRVQTAATALVSPARTMYRSRDALNQVFPYTDRIVTCLAPNHYRLRFPADPGPADYWRGVLYQGLITSHAEHLQVTILPLLPTGFELDAHWD